MGSKFRRQYIIGDYITDFACLEKHLVLEVDGGYHFTEEQKIADEIRSQYLSRLGYRVLRFTNGEVVADIESVVAIIKSALIAN